MKKFFLVACSAVVLSCSAATDPADVWSGLKRVDECAGAEGDILSTAAVTPEQKEAYKGLVLRVQIAGATELDPEAVVMLVRDLDYVSNKRLRVETMEKAFEVLVSDAFVETMSPIQLALLPLFLMKMPSECRSFSTTKEWFAERPSSWLITYRAALAHANAYFAHVFYLENAFNNQSPFVELSEENATKYLDVASGVVAANEVAPVPLPGLLVDIGRGFGLLWHKTPEYEHRFAAAVLDQYIMPPFKEVAPGTEKAKLFDIIKERRTPIRQKADMYFMEAYLEENMRDASPGGWYDFLLRVKELLPEWKALATHFSRAMTDSRINGSEDKKFDPVWSEDKKFDPVWDVFDIMHKHLEEGRN